LIAIATLTGFYQALPRNSCVSGGWCLFELLVTQSEFAELEHAAIEHGLRLSEWIREVLFRELRDRHHTESGDHINYGKRLLTEIVGPQVFLTHVLSTMSRGEWLDAEQYEEITRQVKAKKHRWAQEILAEQPPDTREKNESRPFPG
jgi:hypothetical protein